MNLKMLTNGDDVFNRSVVKGLFPESFVSAREYEEFGSGEAPRYEDVRILLMDAVTSKQNVRDMDASLAISLHKLLPLSRLEASRIGFWHHLCIDVCPEYVLTRWGNVKDLKARFVGRWTRNALGRLWWWAELTKQEGVEPYQLTSSITDQRFMLWTVDRLAAGHSGLTHALCKAFLENIDWAKQNVGQLDNFTDEMWRHVNIRLATVVLDAMDGNDVDELVRGCVEAAKRKWVTQ